MSEELKIYIIRGDTDKVSEYLKNNNVKNKSKYVKYTKIIKQLTCGKYANDTPYDKIIDLLQNV